MTRRWLLLADVRRVAIRAAAHFLELPKLFFNRSDLRISSFLTVLVARRAGRDRHVGREPAQRRRPGDIDVTCRALHHVFALAAFVSEVCRNTFRRKLRHESSCRFVASGTVATGRLLALPMTVEARVVSVRHRLEGKEP